MPSQSQGSRENTDKFNGKPFPVEAENMFKSMGMISRRVTPPAQAITVGGGGVSGPRTSKHPGVLVDSDLSWRKHISNVCVTAKKLNSFSFTFRLTGCVCLNYQYDLIRPVLHQYGTLLRNVTRPP